ncbi:patatin-like phospholipase family protein [Thioalkalivibrio sp. XN8]|uniref:patatin-like phospholipase family protein n=1 Tax=Thioalkalivibrio sp. XN8 TaxID=2712863 RepID=UPI0013E9FB83|nr:patatin-like phospholipase family protein [Thioalkalivibrio sp. XN8]NGP52407.1 patatin family protein [Thioalkalivibrio sp. XN8]
MLQTQQTHLSAKKAGPKIGLALAGGGPLGGIYEIGALLALNEAIDGLDFADVDVYVGVSAGSFVASTLANGITVEEMGRLLVSRRGRPQRFDPALFLKPNFPEYLRRSSQLPKLLAEGLWDFARNPQARGLLESLSGLTRAIPTAVFDNQPIESFLADLFSNRGMTNDFRELQSQLLVVGVDLDTGEAVRFGSPGHDDVPISKAVQASTALPGLYPPVLIGDRYFVDGGLKRTLHASSALDEGVDLLFCVNPIVPFDASAAPPGHDKRHDSLVEGGLPVVLSQTFRALIHSRMIVGMAKYETSYVDRDVVLFEPDTGDSKMFFANVFSYANREMVCQHAYRTTRRDLWARRRKLTPILKRHGVVINEAILQDGDRHFSSALSRRPDPMRLGHYKNRATNRLDGLLDRLEVLVRPSH